jgi:lysozyme
MRKSSLIATAGATAAALMIGIVAHWEGKRNEPYRDVAGIMTVCYGETRVPMRSYSDAECDEILADGINDFARAVLVRNPELRGHPNQLAAATSLSYNIGNAAYSRSTVAKLFSAGRWREACDGFLAWRFAGGRPVQGLLNRRMAERELCRKGL